MNTSWLDDVIVVNESNTPEIGGDVQIYRNETDMGRQLEHWYVSDVEHFVLTGTGDRATLGLRGRLVVVERREKFAEGPEMLRAWLTGSARHVLSVRTARERKGKQCLGRLEAQGVLPDSIEGLIAYIGFMK